MVVLIQSGNNAYVAKKATTLECSKLSLLAQLTNGEGKISDLEGNGSIKSKLSSRVRHKFLEHGMSAKDIPKAILFHEFLGLLLVAITWSSCYYFPPSKVYLFCAFKYKTL